MDELVLPLRAQGELHDEWLSTRLSTVVSDLMKRTGIDCWVLVAREYNEDPVVKTMLPATWLNARRRTILVFTAFGAERVAIARYAVGSAFPAAWSPEDQSDQWERVAEYLTEKNPQRIAINRSNTFSLADGLTASEHEHLNSTLPQHLLDRFEPGEDLAIGWLETRTPDEMQQYPGICRRAHGFLERALSSEVVTPGKTTTLDVEWWLRQEVAASGFDSWFHPTVSAQRDKRAGDLQHLASRPGEETTVAGGLVHIDFGIVHLGLHTDQQQHAYVLKPGETTAPEGLVAGLAAGNRLQDLLMAEFRTGRSGNQILAAARTRARDEGLAATIYSHPIGVHGHGAGPTIGLWDQQQGVAGTGDYPLWPDTAYSIELSVAVDIPEWGGQSIRILLEEDAFFDGDCIEFMDGRQTDFWLIEGDPG